MPAIIPGYEYDIFISYRQNDNRRDDWVTNFVAALKDELEATLKKPVSIYFDENPHDGLLETDQVGATLEKKLKCIVFIPIISQTYCDTSSFAWEHELLPFIKLANEDELGMNITLANGNVASRVLPVQIHDLDSTDQTLIENELGGPLRSIKFIHQAAGVNRPLSAPDDQVRESGKILYSDQINKVANALKEIGNSLVANPSAAQSSSEPMSLVGQKRSSTTGNKNQKHFKLLATIVLIPLILALLYFFFPNQNGENEQVDILEKSIAVLPFADMSPAKDQEWFSDGLTEELLNTLARMPEIKLMARTSSFSFKGKNLPIQKIADSLHVNYILEGSVRKTGNKLRITAQLIQASDGSHLWSNTYDRTTRDVFSIQEDISESIAQALDILLDEEKRSRMYSVGTRNTEAYEEYLKGNGYYKKAHAYSTTDSSLLKANLHFEKAISLDPGFSQPYSRHQDFYAHYFVEGKRGVYKYVLNEFTDNEVNKLLSADLDAAIKNSQQPAFKIGYQLDKIFLSDNWQEARGLINQFKNLSELSQSLIIYDFSWFTHMFNYADPEIMNKLYLKRIENDPYDYTAYNLFLSSLIRMNLLDSAATFFDDNRMYIQNVPNVTNKRAAIAIINGNFQEAYEITKKVFLNQSIANELYDHYYILSRLLVGDKKGLPDIKHYVKQSGLRALPFYNITGQYEKADSLAHAFDAQFLGPCIISRFIFGNPLLFHLSATPNFAARLKELGVDPVQYEKEYYIKLPVTPLLFD